jgi:hypothetical protein
LFADRTGQTTRALDRNGNAQFDPALGFDVQIIGERTRDVA